MKDMTTLTITPAQITFYRTASNPHLSDGERVRAAVKAVEATSLMEEGFSESSIISIEEILEDTCAVVAALNGMGEYSEDEQEGFGANLAELLLDNDIHELVANAQADYLVNRQADANWNVTSMFDAYEVSDPKHPGFMDRLDSYLTDVAA